MKVHILIGPLDTVNSQGLYVPILRYRKDLYDRGLNINFFNKVSECIHECDNLILDSKFFKPWWRGQSRAALDLIEGLGEKVSRLYWFNTADSTGGLQNQILPRVDRYIKAQVLKDRNLYLDAHYGDRVYTDHCHTHAGVMDSSPIRSRPVENKNDIDKIVLGWNYGLVAGFNRSLDMRRIYSKLFSQRLIGAIMRNTPEQKSRYSDIQRPHAFSIFAKMNLKYSRETIAYQRKNSLEKLIDYSMDSGSVGRRKYFKALRRCHVALSPFGWGEINIRDFEAFAAGALLLKQNMSHVETFPPYYEEGVTYVPYKWDASDLREKVAHIEAHSLMYREVANNGQTRLKFFEREREGKEAVVTHIAQILS